MRALRPLAVLALALVLSGCFQTKTLVRLNADGSGTVEETVLMSSSMAMAIMMGGMDLLSEEGDEEPEIPDGPYSMEALEARATSLNATFASVEPVDILFGGGYTAIYAFDDINTLQLTAGPDASLPDGLGSQLVTGAGESMEYDEEGNPIEASQEDESADLISFEYQDGRLKVRMPRPDAPEVADEETDDEDEKSGPNASEFQQMKTILKDMRFSLAVELPSPVRETNASNVDGQLMTLFDIDFGTLLNTPGAFEQIEALDLDGPPKFSASAMASFPTIPGFVFEHEQEVTVSF